MVGSCRGGVLLTLERIQPLGASPQAERNAVVFLPAIGHSTDQQGVQLISAPIRQVLTFVSGY